MSSCMGLVKTAVLLQGIFPRFFKTCASIVIFIHTRIAVQVARARGAPGERERNVLADGDDER